MGAEVFKQLFCGEAFANQCYRFRARIDNFLGAINDQCLDSLCYRPATQAASIKPIEFSLGHCYRRSNRHLCGSGPTSFWFLSLLGCVQAARYT